jgi:glutamate dehydrogenase (NAD(P)+)
MVSAYQQICKTWRADSKIPGLRTAAFISAMDKIATCYAELGHFLDPLYLELNQNDQVKTSL